MSRIAPRTSTATCCCRSRRRASMSRAAASCSCSSALRRFAVVHRPRELHAVRVRVEQMIDESVVALVAERAHARQARRFDDGQLLLRQIELRGRGANVRALAERPFHRGLLVFGWRQRHRHERVAQADRRIERQVECAKQIEPRAVSIVARGDELRARGRELRLGASDVQPDADAGGELVAGDRQQVDGKRRIGDARLQRSVAPNGANVDRRGTRRGRLRRGRDVGRRGRARRISRRELAGSWSDRRSTGSAGRESPRSSPGRGSGRSDREWASGRAPSEG